MPQIEGVMLQVSCCIQKWSCEGWEFDRDDFRSVPADIYEIYFMFHSGLLYAQVW